MNIKILTSIVVTIAVAGAIVFFSAVKDGPKPIDPRNVVKTKVNMTGMTCGHCEVAIEKVGETAGVAKIKATSEDQRVDVEYDKTQTDINIIMKAIEMKGFTPVSYEDDKGLHELNTSTEKISEPKMKCGAGKCGSKM